MPDATLNIIEGDLTPPPTDPTGIVAFLGTCTGLGVGKVAAFDSPSTARATCGAGPLAQICETHSRTSKKRVYGVSLLGSIAGVLGVITQVGQGPTITASGAPYDSRAVAVRISTAGAGGSGKFQLSIASSVVAGVASPLYGGQIDIPVAKAAGVVGTVDLTTLTYAKPAKQVGTVDMTSAALYGIGGTIGTKTVIDAANGGGGITATFANPLSAQAVVDTLNAANPLLTWSVDQQNHLAVQTKLLGAAAEINITGGTALGALGLSVADVTGTAGAIDGLTLIVNSSPASSAQQIGTADLTNAALYGAGGILNGLTLVLTLDGGTVHTTTFSAPATFQDVLDQINASQAVTTASKTALNRLALTSLTTGAASEVKVTNTSTSLTALGLAATDVFGVAGGSPTTVTFTAVGTPAALAAAVQAAVASSAVDVFGSANRLRIQTTATGSTALLAVTGGTGRVTLGLPLTTSQGASATYLIVDLGVTLTFGAGPYALLTTYSFNTKGPMFSTTDVEAGVAALLAAKVAFEIIGFSQEVADATDALALVNDLDGLIVAQEPRGTYIQAFVGVNVDEADVNVKNAVAGLTTRNVSVFARGCYIRDAAGGGSTIRSAAIAGARKAARDRFSSDIGNHKDGDLSSLEVDGIRSQDDESTATTKLRDSRCCVIENLAAGLFFSRGLTMAPSSSAYRDLNVTRLIKDGARTVKPILDKEVNDDPPVKKDGSLLSPEEINLGARTALINRLINVPSGQHPHASAADVQVDATYNVAANRKLPGNIVVTPNGQIEGVVFNIMAGRAS